MKLDTTLLILCSFLFFLGCNQDKNDPLKQHKNPWFEECIDRWKNGNEMERWNAIADIGKRGHFEITDKDLFALPFLRERFKSGDEAEREAAIKAMGLIKSAESLPDVQDALKDESFFIRKMAIWALNQLDDPEKIEHILPMLEDENVLVRQRAADTLKHVVKDEKVKKRILEIETDLPEITIEIDETHDPEKTGKAVFDALKESLEDAGSPKTHEEKPSAP